MNKRALLTDQAPRPIGPYSQGIRADRWIFVSGQVPIDPATGELTGGTIAAQTRRVMDNILAILKEAGLGAEHVVKTTIYLADMGDFAAMNEVYATYFTSAPPARATVQAARLPKDARIEIDAIALG
jgi:2-iminobutanoate/2-iminopropanoate deaminase